MKNTEQQKKTDKETDMALISENTIKKIENLDVVPSDQPFDGKKIWEANFPHEMRFKHFVRPQQTAMDKHCFKMEWVTQEYFDREGLEQFKRELCRVLEAILPHGEQAVITVKLSVRDDVEGTAEFFNIHVVN